MAGGLASAPASPARRHDWAPTATSHPALFVDLVVWEGQAEAAAEHLVKGQAVSFTGCFEPREYTTSAGEKRLALEVHDVAIEYGTGPRRARPSPTPTPSAPRRNRTAKTSHSGDT